MIKISDNIVRFEVGDATNGYQRSLVGYGFDIVRDRVVSWKNTTTVTGMLIGYKTTYRLNGINSYHSSLKRGAEEFLARNADMPVPACPVGGVSYTIYQVTFNTEVVVFSRKHQKSQYFYGGTTLKTILDSFHARKIDVTVDDLTFLEVPTGKIRTLKKVTTYVLE